MSKPHLAEVVTLYEQNASNIVAMLREAADNIERGDCSPVRSMTAVAELEGGGVMIYGWGATDTPRSIAILQLGLAQLVNDQLATWSDDA